MMTTIIATKEADIGIVIISETLINNHTTNHIKTNQHHHPMTQSRLFSIVAIVLSLVLFCIATATTAVDPSCKGQPNTNPVWRGEPTLVSTTTNGKRYIVGEGDDRIHLVHVYGSAYEMGEAYGQMMGKELHDQLETYFAYLQRMIGDYLKNIPEPLRSYVAKHGLKAALDLNYLITKKYTPAHYEEEMKGMEAGSGVNYIDIRRLNLLPELIKAGCSIVGAWGTSSTNGTLFHGRQLDWDARASIAKYPQIVIYHPDEGHSFANIGYVGLVGTITGISEASISISEKVWLNYEKDPSSRFGTPWNYVLRDVLQFADNMDSALEMISNAKRTCAIHVGVGDSNSGSLSWVKYAAHAFEVYDDTNQLDTPDHPRMKNLVYVDKSSKQTSRCYSSQLQEYYGKIGVASLIREIIPISQTGDTQSAVMDIGNMRTYVAYSAYLEGGEKGPLYAYDRQYVEVDLKRAFTEKL